MENVKIVHTSGLADFYSIFVQFLSSFFQFFFQFLFSFHSIFMRFLKMVTVRGFVERRTKKIKILTHFRTSRRSLSLCCLSDNAPNITNTRTRRAASSPPLLPIYNPTNPPTQTPRAAELMRTLAATFPAILTRRHGFRAIFFQFSSGFALRNYHGRPLVTVVRRTSTSMTPVVTTYF